MNYEEFIAAQQDPRVNVDLAQAQADFESAVEARNKAEEALDEYHSRSILKKFLAVLSNSDEGEELAASLTWAMREQFHAQDVLLKKQKVPPYLQENI